MPSNGRVLMFTENPGLIHIGWEIFRQMKLRHLLKSRLVCRSWKSVVDNPHFWLKAYKKTRPEITFPPKWKEFLDLLEGWSSKYALNRLKQFITIEECLPISIAAVLHLLPNLTSQGSLVLQSNIMSNIWWHDL